MSVQLSTQAPPRLAGPDAVAGTVQHSILEKCLTEDLEVFELGDLQMIRVDGHDVEVTHAMLDNVDVCLTWVRENLAGRELLVEKDVHLRFAEAHLDRPFYGWVDVAAVPIPVTVCDFKSGHTFVPATPSQLGLYLLGLGARPHGREAGGRWARRYHGHHAAAGGGRTSAHPRLDVARSAGLARSGDQPVAPDQTERFYIQIRRALPVVPGDRGLPAHRGGGEGCGAGQGGSDAELIATGEISAAKLDEWLANADVLELWIKQLNAMAEDYLLHGGRLETRKLVKKRTNRRWSMKPGD